jgi:hypothetical protein
LAGLAVAAGLVGVVGIWRIDDATQTTALERVLQAQQGKQITAVGVDEMRSVYGRDLDADVRSVRGDGQAGERPPEGGVLAAANAASGSDVLVVQDGTPGVPAGWEPPSAAWTKTASTEAGDVYIRKQ